MPNLKRPEGLVIKKGRWNKLCIDCKHKIVKDDIIENVLAVLCPPCKDVFIGKKFKAILGCKKYKIRPVCRKCGERFDSNVSIRAYCDNCKNGG